MHTLHIVMGPPAAGKTTYGRRLAAERRATFIDIDSATEPVVKAGLKLAGQDPDDRDSPLFKSAFRDPIYEALFALASDNLPHTEVVIVGPFTQEARDSDWLETLKRRFKTEVTVYFVTCDLPTRKARLEQRGNPRDRAKLEDWDRFIQYYKGDDPPAFRHILVDTTCPSSP